VVGVAKGNFMNLSTSLALYAVVNKELTGEIEFPGSETFYNMFDSFTYAPLHADFQLWAALEPRCGNQAFNVVNGDVETWANMWPKVAKRFGCKVPSKQFERKTPESSQMKLADVPPFEDIAAVTGMEGKIKQGVVEQRIDLVKWSKKPEVKKTWERIAERDGLEKDAFEKATWDFLGFVLGRNYNIVISMSKAREYGFNGYKDTWQSFMNTFDELEKLKILPKVDRL
jgi:hypothetical protein